MSMDPLDRQALVEAARGSRPCTLLIRSAQVVNVFTQEIYAADIGVYGRHIAYVGPPNEVLDAEATYDAAGRFAVPGLIDPHLHIESSMVTPANYARAVLPHGTTTVIVDPHELANVFGLRGVHYMVEASRGLPLRVLIAAPSCVPSVPGMETAGADFFAPEIETMLGWERVIGLAEVMDYPGVIKQTARMRDIVDVALSQGAVVQSHAPLVLGRRLAAYLCAGPRLEHEAREGDEALAKLRAGMVIQARQGSNSQNVVAIINAVKDMPLPPNLCLCTDDVSPVDLVEKGGLDQALRLAIGAGLRPEQAVCCATLHTARSNDLHTLGALAPGYVADVVLAEDLRHFQASAVFTDGQLVAENGHLTVDLAAETFALEQENSVHMAAPPGPGDFELAAPIPDGVVTVQVLQAGREKINLTDLVRLDVPVRDGLVRYDAREDLSLIAIVERHGRHGRVGRGLIKDLGLQRGAAATTVAHDSHNLLVAGRNAHDMARAAGELIACHGGYVAVADGAVLGLVPLPLGGLISLLPATELAPAVKKVREIMADLGIRGADPMFTLAGLALAVTPRYKVTDLGLLDVENQVMLPLFV